MKKAHFHVIACYSGPTSFNVVRALTDSLHCPIPQPLEQVRGYYRYFTHLDNPEKFQYDAGRIQCLNGFCITDYVELTKSEVLRIKQDLQGFIRAQNILEYSDLMDTLQDNGNADYYDVASSNTYFLRNTSQAVAIRQSKLQNGLRKALAMRSKRRQGSGAIAPPAAAHARVACL